MNSNNKPNKQTYNYSIDEGLYLSLKNKYVKTVARDLAFRVAIVGLFIGMCFSVWIYFGSMALLGLLVGVTFIVIVGISKGGSFLPDPFSPLEAFLIISMSQVLGFLYFVFRVLSLDVRKPLLFKRNEIQTLSKSTDGTINITFKSGQNYFLSRTGMRSDIYNMSSKNGFHTWQGWKIGELLREIN